MYGTNDPQGTFMQTFMLLTPRQMEIIRKSWVWTFYEEAMPLIDADLFAPMFKEGGRPSKPIDMMIGLLILKDMFDLTDEETLQHLTFDLRWQVALGLEPDAAYCCPKTLYNFRARLMAHEGGLLLFNDLANKIVAKLGLVLGLGRMDSTHFRSNVARLSRLQLFCETIRVFLNEVKALDMEKYLGVAVSLRGRYVREDGEATKYADGRSSETARRLPVCARDVWRLLDHFRGDVDVAELPAARQLQRLFVEQCELAPEAAPAAADEADADAPFAPVVAKPSKDIRSDAMQTPHDETMTYNKHKGQGYEGQIAETCGNGDKPEALVSATPGLSCQGDPKRTIPTVTDLAERGLAPGAMIADTNYGSTANIIECAKLGTDLQTPVSGPERKPEPDPAQLPVGAFDIDVNQGRPVRCPEGHEAVEETRQDNGGKVHIEAVFDGTRCAQCPHRQTCPTRERADGQRVLKTTLQDAVLDKWHHDAKTPEFKKRYKMRAGIEATNSELKRGHGLGKVRVRGAPAVTLAFYLKCTACNVKRMVKYLTEQRRMKVAMS